MRNLLLALLLASANVSAQVSFDSATGDFNNDDSTGGVTGLPASVAADKIMVAVLNVDATSSPVWNEPGWSTIYNPGENSNCLNDGNGGSQRPLLLWKLAGASEPASVTTSFGAAQQWVSVVLMFDNVDTGTSPEWAQVDGGATNTPASPAISPSWGATEESVFLSIVTTNSSSSSNSGHAAPTGYTVPSTGLNGGDCPSADTICHTNSSSNVNIMAGYNIATESTETPASWSYSGSARPFCGWTIAIKAGGGGGPDPVLIPVILRQLGDI